MSKERNEIINIMEYRFRWIPKLEIKTKTMYTKQFLSYKLDGRLVLIILSLVGWAHTRIPVGLL